MRRTLSKISQGADVSTVKAALTAPFHSMVPCRECCMKMTEQVQNCKKKISHRHWGPLHGSSSPFYGPLSRRELNPIKPVYDPDWPDGRLNLTASAFNQLGQYTSSSGRSIYCYAELAVFSLAVAVTIASTYCAYPQRDGQAELAWVAGYVVR